MPTIPFLGLLDFLGRFLARKFLGYFVVFSVLSKVLMGLALTDNPWKFEGTICPKSSWKYVFVFSVSVSVSAPREESCPKVFYLLCCRSKLKWTAVSASATKLWFPNNFVCVCSKLRKLCLQTVSWEAGKEGAAETGVKMGPEKGA